MQLPSTMYAHLVGPDGDKGTVTFKPAERVKRGVEPIPRRYIIAKTATTARRVFEAQDHDGADVLYREVW